MFKNQSQFHNFNISNDNLIEVMKSEKWKKPHNETFTIKYDGKAVESHEIDANVFANSLLGLSNALDHATHIINGSDANMFVKVKASFNPGSFDVEIVTLLTCASFQAAINVVSAVGFMGDSVKSLIWLYKQTKGEQIEKIERLKDDMIKVYTKNCYKPIITNHIVVEMYNDKKLRRELGNLVSPLNDKEMSHIAFLTDGTEYQRITREEKEYFTSCDDDQTITESIDHFVVTQSNLFGKSTGWRLAFADLFKSIHDKNDFSVKILDNSFLKNVKNRQITISNKKPITIKAKYRKTTQKLERFVTSWEILEVLDYTYITNEYKKTVTELDDF